MFHSVEAWQNLVQSGTWSALIFNQSYYTDYLSWNEIDKYFGEKGIQNCSENTQKQDLASSIMAIYHSFWCLFEIAIEFFCNSIFF